MTETLIHFLSKKKTWFLLILGFVTIALVGSALFFITRKIVIDDAERDIQYLLLQNKALHLYIQRDSHPALYRLKEQGEVKDDFYSPELLSSSYMARVIQRYLNEVRQEAGLQNIYYKMAATNPRNPVNLADEFEIQLIQLFNQDRSKTSYRTIQTLDGVNYLYYAIPFLTTNEACLKCHSDRATAPRQLQALYQGEGGFGDKVGSIRAIESIRIPLSPILAPAHIFYFASLAGGLLILFILLLSQRLKEQVRQRTRALQESEARFRRLTENAKDMIYRISIPDGVYEYISPASTSLTGYSPEEFYATPLLVRQIIHPHWLDYFEKEWKNLLAGNNPQSYEYQIIHQSGETRWLNQRNVLIRDTQDRPIALEGIVTDVTEQKKLEEQLLQSQKMEAIGHLAGGVAHDFNNLLTAINGYSEIVLGSLPQNDLLRDDVAEIKKAGERATALTRQLLAFSRKQIMQPKIVHLNELIQNVGKMLRRLIGENIELITQLAETVWPVKADPGQIEQVLMNLSVNARDAMPNGGTLIIETLNVTVNDAYIQDHREITPGNYAAMMITDTGCGMSKEIQEHIFEPFFTTKDRTKGTGLGLSTVYGIIKQSGGHIWVYSEEGKGTTFKILLPYIGEEAEISAQEKPALDALHGSETILLVEDEEIVRKLISRTLHENGYTVLEAANGNEALHLQEQYKNPIHLLLTDVVMPEMGGPELTKQIALTHPHLKIIFMSGYTNHSMVLHGIEEENLVFLQKPAQPQEMLRTIRRVLDSKE